MIEQEKLAVVLSICKKHLGVKESPANSNNVIFNTLFYGHEVTGPKYPWCGTFDSEVYQEAKIPLGNIGYMRGFASVPYAIDNLAKWGKQVTAEEALPGYIVMYKFTDEKGNLVWAHTGILQTKVINNSFGAYEGNTAVGNDSNGGEVMLRTRKYSENNVMIIRPNCLDK